MNLSEQKKAFILGIIDGWYERWEVMMIKRFPEAMDNLKDLLCELPLDEEQLRWVNCVIKAVYDSYKDHLQAALARPDLWKEALKKLLFGPVQIEGKIEGPHEYD